jgi:hypothetical protein
MHLSRLVLLYRHRILPWIGETDNVNTQMRSNLTPPPRNNVCMTGVSALPYTSTFSAAFLFS